MPNTPRSVDEHAETADAGALADAGGVTLASGEHAAVDPEGATHQSDPGGARGGHGAPPALSPGDVLGEVYEVIERIGTGGMGSVYLVEHRELGRRFAAKVVAPHNRHDATAVRRLRQEARTASTIDHENIVDVTDLGRTDDGSLFVIMELLEGEDLRDRLRRAVEHAGHLPDDETRVYVRQILGALEAAHEAGVIHRDLKPENVFLARKGSRQVVKIVDFGISKVRDPDQDTGITQTGQILGTPLYMAPEQGRSTRQVDGRTDLYSLACIVFEMVTGRVPFAGETVYDCVVLHATEPPPRPTELRERLPAEVEAWILRGLAKEPGARFESAAAMLEAWERAWDAPPEAAAEKAEAAPDPEPVSEPARPAATAIVPARVETPIAAEPPRGMEPPVAPGLRRALPWMGLGLALAALGSLGVIGDGDEDAPAPTVAAPPTEVRAPEPAPPVTPPAPPETPAAPGEPLVRHLETDPPGAEVVVGGQVVGETPHALPLEGDAPVEVTLRRAGYEELTRSVGPDDPDPLRVSLSRRRRSRPAQPALAPQ